MTSTKKTGRKKVDIIIDGAPHSKKNNRRNFGHISLPSKAYETFHESALWQLKKVKDRFTGRVHVHYTFIQKGKMHQDCDNAIASINDVLQDAGIIVDDNDIVSGTFEKRSGSEWKTLIEIQEVL